MIELGLAIEKKAGIGHFSKKSHEGCSYVLCIPYYLTNNLGNCDLTVVYAKLAVEYTMYPIVSGIN